MDCNYDTMDQEDKHLFIGKDLVKMYYKAHHIQDQQSNEVHNNAMNYQKSILLENVFDLLQYYF
jgi:hypothetical protein